MNYAHFATLETKIPVVFKNKKLLAQAFIHRSYLNETRETWHSNERLEFLGDAVLSFFTSHYIYRQYPDLPEGMLTNIRSSVVKTETLAQVATELQFGQYLLLSRGEEDGGGRTNPSLLADCFEAFLGTLFLDQGMPAVEKFLKKYLLTKIPDIIAKRAYLDYKSQLQEKIQEKQHVSPLYRVFRTEGQDHAKTFWIEVVVNNTMLGQGKGRSKQEAEQNAARQALEKAIEV